MNAVNTNTGERTLITVSRADPHLPLVTLCRPEARNAVSVQLARELDATVAALEADEQVRAVILTGEGDVFCAGADLREVAAGRLASLFTERGGFAGFVDAPRRKPWIAAVNGPALAGGFEIVLACDIVIASTTARFGLPEVTRGLIASAGGLHRLPRALPKAIAIEMILTGDAMDVGRAQSFGLVNHVVECEALLDTARIVAGRIASAAPLAVQESLTIAKLATNFDDAILRERGDAAQDRLGNSADYAEGARAFLEKRAPVWQGR